MGIWIFLGILVISIAVNIPLTIIAIKGFTYTKNMRVIRDEEKSVPNMQALEEAINKSTSQEKEKNSIGEIMRESRGMDLALKKIQEVFGPEREDSFIEGDKQ
jgi:DNA helicase HerA-like ATPase